MASSGSNCLDSGTLHCQYTAMPDDDRYSLTELADLAGVTPRTVRYYLAQGLLPAVGQSGPGSKYDAGHLARLRVIRRLQAEHLPLAEIRRRLETLDDGEIRELVDAGEPPPPTDTALEYLRTVLAGPPVGLGLRRASRSRGPPPRARGTASSGGDRCRCRPWRRHAIPLPRSSRLTARKRRSMHRARPTFPPRHMPRPPSDQATAPSGNGSCSRRISNSTSGARSRGRRTSRSTAS